jgi:aspartate carbamoyltransferase catalytic subunit
MLHRKDLLTIEELSVEEMEMIFSTANAFKQANRYGIRKLPDLRGKTVVNLFYEPSTRTRTSFEMAAMKLGADVINIVTTTSSVVKGESLLDTSLTLDAMGVDFIIIRHSMAGAPRLVAKHVAAAVINAGDGAHEHPTQALLDLLTIKQKKGRIKGLKVAIVGDILHSRVARSNIWGLVKLGAQVTVAGPKTLLPPQLSVMGVEVYDKLDEAIRGADVINVLRIQRERQEEGLFPSINEYARLYQLNSQRLKLANKDVLVLHPGPINRGVEISSEVADGPHSAILEQVNNGLAIRMALLKLLNRGVKCHEVAN